MEQKGIILKNINLTGISKLEQSIKIDEELTELKEAFISYSENKTEDNKNHVIEEWHDRNQAELGLLEKEGITAQEVMEGYPLHEEKLKNRPRIKKCNKCIKYMENPNNENIFICLKDSSELKIDLDIAKECKCYKEQDE